MMTVKDALNILDCATSSTLEDIKSAYRRACKMYHPDRNPAGLEMMKLINAAYDALRDYKPTTETVDPTQEQNLGDDLNTALNAIIHLGLTIEICGSWLWVSGDTRPHKEVLKEAGFKWAPKKMMWHFRPSDYKSYNRGKWSIDKIRETHGSQTSKNKSYQRLSA